MNRVFTDAEQNIAREKASRGYRRLIDELNIEMSSRGGATDFGTIRKHTSGPRSLMMAGTLTRQAKERFLWLGFVALDGLAKTAGQLVQTISLLSRDWPGAREQLARGSYLDVANTMSPDLGVSFSTVAVSAQTADILRQQIGEVEAAQTKVFERHAERKFLGPFIEEKAVHDLKRAFTIRYDADTRRYGHCLHYVDRLEEACGAPEKTQLVHTFGVISAPSGTKGYDTKAAEAGAEISASNLADLKAAIPASPIPPPQFNIV